MRYENPLYMAETAAATDLLAGGRLQLGVSRGSPEPAWHGAEAFGYSVEHDDARTKTAFFRAAIAGAGVARADVGGGLHRRIRPDRRRARERRRRPSGRHDPPHGPEPARRRLQRRDARDDRTGHRAGHRLEPEARARTRRVAAKFASTHSVAVSAGVRAEYAVREREHHELGARFEPQLAHDVRPTRIDRAHRDEELLRDRLIRIAEGEQMDDVALAVGERLERRRAAGNDELRAQAGFDVAGAVRDESDSGDELAIGGR